VELTAPGLTNGRRIVRALAVFVFASGLALSGARVVGSNIEPVLFIPAGLAVVVGWLVYRQHVVVRFAAQVAGFVASGMAVAYASGGTAKSFTRGLLDGPHQILTTAWPNPRFWRTREWLCGCGAPTTSRKGRVDGLRPWWQPICAARA